jgi:hypothetical protein
MPAVNYLPNPGLQHALFFDRSIKIGGQITLPAEQPIVFEEDNRDHQNFFRENFRKSSKTAGLLKPSISPSLHSHLRLAQLPRQKI